MLGRDFNSRGMETCRGSIPPLWRLRFLDRGAEWLKHVVHSLCQSLLVSVCAGRGFWQSGGTSHSGPRPRCCACAYVCCGAAWRADLRARVLARTAVGRQRHAIIGQVLYQFQLVGVGLQLGDVLENRAPSPRLGWAGARSTGAVAVVRSPAPGMLGVFDARPCGRQFL